MMLEAWGTHGAHMGLTWGSHGAHMGLTWATHGPHIHPQDNQTPTRPD